MELQNVDVFFPYGQPLADGDRKILQAVVCHCGGGIGKFQEFKLLDEFLARAEAVPGIHYPDYRCIIALVDSAAGGAVGILRNRYLTCEKFPRLRYSLWIAFSGIVAAPRLLDFCRSIGTFTDEQNDEPRLLETLARDPLLIVTSGCTDILRLQRIAKRALDLAEGRITATRRLSVTAPSQPAASAASSQTFRAVRLPTDGDDPTK